MANKSLSKDRRAVINDIRKKQGRAERARGAAIVGVCVIIALVIVGAAAWGPITDFFKTSKYDDVALQDIGKSTKAAGCQKVIETKADGNQNHIATGTEQTYTTAPPAFGPHWNEANVAPADMSRKFYSAGDRPDLEALVHNLEHGYTIVWYDETVSEDELNLLRVIGEKFAGTANFRYKFIAAPWTAADAKETAVAGDKKTEFPSGTHIALTHWYADPANPSEASTQKGVFQYCEGVSGEAIKDFMQKYPYTDTPEPQAM
ncbi:hypothetical protein J2S40_003026 [Nocardioides luteus]|uniref:DUF3105 domain-containing protein n=1 Tax=Nocardioides luteus TaxID=1844 RepID=A0ABQ5SWJ1_9ACTN|nr:DUF3105 domain-containing protein [Nocardioides luteus]MDR7311968.1 hypothetical protein [Nocardioides luteus]GGR68388.1 hypothetical protein GCM10010197_39790 [Nocardioides luteus]GLJ68211.1 hypothetical protein GCM10017579_22470 [Nocardioides luteus]